MSAWAAIHTITRSQFDPLWLFSSLGKVGDTCLQPSCQKCWNVLMSPSIIWKRAQVWTASGGRRCWLWHLTSSWALFLTFTRRKTYVYTYHAVFLMHAVYDPNLYIIRVMLIAHTYISLHLYVGSVYNIQYVYTDRCTVLEFLWNLSDFWSSKDSVKQQMNDPSRCLDCLSDQMII